MDSSIYRHVFGQIPPKNKIKHYNYPCHNLISLDRFACSSTSHVAVDDGTVDSKDFLSTFPCFKPFDYDHSMTSVLHAGLGVSDVAQQVLDNKRKWERREKYLRPKNTKKALAQIKRLKRDGKGTLPLKLLMYTQHMKNEPSPAFSGQYNWLYSGGNLASIELENNSIVIGADGATSSVLNFIQLKEHDVNQIINKSQYGLKMTQPILQITANAQQDRGLVCVRQRNNLTLWNADSKLQVSAVWKKKIDQGKMLTSSDLDGFEVVGLVDSDGNASMYNVETRKLTARKSVDIENQCDRFSQVFFSDKQVFIGTRKHVFGYDLRMKDPTPCVSFAAPTVAETCENICRAWVAAHDSRTVYLALSHHLLEVDMRCGKPKQQWTHQMKCPPQFGVSAHVNGQQVIIVQSYRPEEVLGVMNDRTGGEGGVYCSTSLPVVLPSILDTLRAAQYRDCCLDPQVSERFKYHVTGTCLTAGPRGSMNLLTSNSVGDVFAMELERKDELNFTKRDLQSTLNRNLRTMQSYEDNWAGVRRPARVHVSEVVDMQHMLDRLRAPSARPGPARPVSSWWPSREMFDLESLRQYKDMLAHRILAVWGVGGEEEDSRMDTTQESSAKVEKWLLAHQHHTT